MISLAPWAIASKVAVQPSSKPALLDDLKIYQPVSDLFVWGGEESIMRLALVSVMFPFTVGNDLQLLNYVQNSTERD